MKRYIFLLVILLGLPTVAYAESTSSAQVRLNVYPINCMFEEVNNGTGQVTFLTPAECGQNLTIIQDTSQALGNDTPIQVSIPSDEPPNVAADETSAPQTLPATSIAEPHVFLPSLGKLAMASVGIAAQPLTVAGAAVATAMISLFVGQKSLNKIGWIIRIVFGLLLGKK